METDHSKSDHLVAYLTLDLPRRESFEWVTYSYRFFTEEAREEFGQWMVTHDWSEVWEAVGSDAKAEAYQAKMDWAMDAFFPLRTMKKKSTDLPWINRAIRKRIRRRMAVYRKEGRSELWKFLKTNR